MRRGRLFAPIFVLASLGFGADGAGAEVFCVNKSPCIGTTKSTIQGALDDAATNGGIDSIFIGANGGTPYNETLTYSDSETVHVIGDGAEETIIAGTNSFQIAVTLLNPSSSIEDLTIRAPDKSNGTALRWDGTASNIEAVHLGSSATETLGMQAEGSAVLEDSTVDVNGFGLFSILNNASDVEIRDSTLKGDGTGISVGDGTLTLRRSTVVSARSPITAGNGGDYSVLNALLRMTGSVAVDGALYQLSGSEGIVRNATIVGPDTGRGALVDSTSGDTKLTIFDSIIDGFQTALLCSGTAPNKATLGVSYSNWTEPTETGDADCEFTNGAGNKAIEPVYASTDLFLPNFALKAPSPLIDAGGPIAPLLEDILNAPRPVDGDGVGGPIADMGAYEYQRQAPAASMNAPATAVVGEAASFSGAGSDDPDPGDALSFAWEFGDGGTAEGFAPQHNFNGAGTFTVTLLVTDPTGLSDTASAQIQVSSPTAPGTTGKPSNKGGKKPKKPKQPKTATITALRAVPKRIKRGSGLPKLVPGLKRPGFQLELSKKAKVTLSLARCKGRQGCVKKVAVPGSVSFKAAAGASTIKFRGRLTGPKLRKGRYRATLTAPGGDSRTASFRLI